MAERLDDGESGASLRRWFLGSAWHSRALRDVRDAVRHWGRLVTANLGASPSGKPAPGFAPFRTPIRRRSEWCFATRRGRVGRSDAAACRSPCRSVAGQPIGAIPEVAFAQAAERGACEPAFRIARANSCTTVVAPTSLRRVNNPSGGSATTGSTARCLTPPRATSSRACS